MHAVSDGISHNAVLGRLCSSFT